MEISASTSTYALPPTPPAPPRSESRPAEAAPPENTAAGNTVAQVAGSSQDQGSGSTPPVTASERPPEPTLNLQGQRVGTIINTSA